MGGLLAEKLAKDGHAVSLVTPAVQVSQWTVNTMEQGRIQVRLMQLGVDLICAHDLLSILIDQAEIACVYTGKTRLLPAQTIVMVTSRRPANGLFLDLQARADVFPDAGIKSVTAIGDCLRQVPSPARSIPATDWLGNLAKSCRRTGFHSGERSSRSKADRMGSKQMSNKP